MLVGLSIYGVGGLRTYPKTVSRFGASRGFLGFSDRFLITLSTRRRIAALVLRSDKPKPKHAAGRKNKKQRSERYVNGQHEFVMLCYREV
jgi:hypothetical protein